MKTTSPVKLTMAQRQELKHCEAVIEQGLKTFVDVGNALSEIRESKLYLDEHATFEAYCKARWGFTDRRARQIMEAAETGRILPVKNASQAAELVKLPEPERAAAWQEVEEKAKTEGKPVTAKMVHEVVARRIEPEPFEAGGSVTAEASEPEPVEQSAVDPETPAGPKPGTLEYAQAACDRIEASAKELRAVMRWELDIEGQEIRAPWLSGLTVASMVGQVNQILRVLKDFRPVGGTAKKPQSALAAKREEARS